ncbi:3-oxoacyl-ACP reductase [Mycolicibacterium neworleansense]|uniref:3-oxoacyl-ACP reductase n=1 Tax=Mycolicibacterium neworleansense TaxID=146018 RepID=A0A0H5RRT0_9MYCO|nr:3-oxoacyl-ACP reductase [Mycolicibacterium neworleansense]
MSAHPSWSSPRTAIVTGGASGIGLAIARRLSEEGAAVAIFDRDATAAIDSAKAITDSGGWALGLRVDVTDRFLIDAAIETTTEELGPPTILVTAPVSTDSRSSCPSPLRAGERSWPST